MLNEPQLKHVHANEGSVVSKPLQRACFHPKNISDSTEKLRLGLPGGLWKGASAQLQIATSTLKKTHKLAEKWKHLCISLDTEWEPVHSFPPPVLPAHRWFGGWDQKDVWLTIWCCFTGWGHTAAIGILSDSLEYCIILFYWVIKSDLTSWLWTFYFKETKLQLQLCDKQLDGGLRWWKGDGPVARFLLTSVPFECACACRQSLIGASLTALTKWPLRRWWWVSVGPSPVSTRVFTFALSSFPSLLSSQPSASFMYAAAH